jgi:hypothetical protein
METPRPKGAKGGSGTPLGITNLRFRLHSPAHKMTSFAGRIVSFVLGARSSFTKSRTAGVVGSIRHRAILAEEILFLTLHHERLSALILLPIS